MAKDEASAAPAATIEDKRKTPERPEKPDEEQFKADLAKAEKEHAAVMERLVRSSPTTHWAFQRPIPRIPKLK